MYNIEANMKKPNVGFIGLGLMGNPMAKNIIKAGFPLRIYNRNIVKTQELADLGAYVCESPKEIGFLSDVVITCVTGPEDVESVLFSDNGVTVEAKKRLVVIDMSTIGPTAAREIAKKLKQKTIDFIDAPVTGSVPKAETGELVIFVGGEDAVVKKVNKILEAMGKSIHHMGGIGMGQAMKMVNNQLLAGQLVVLSESMLLADKMGLERGDVIDVLSTTASFSGFMKFKSQAIINEDFDKTAFSLANMHKDQKLALQEMAGDKAKTPALELVEKLFEKGGKQGLGGKDLSAIIEVLAKNY